MATQSSSSEKDTTQSQRHWIIIASILAILVILVTVIVVVILQNNDTPSEQTVDEARVIGEVAMTAEGLLPTTITIKRGQTVTWTNQDAKPHVIKSVGGDNSSLIDSQDVLNTGDTYSVSFPDAGTFQYSDGTADSRFSGSIIVE